eukprot:6465004-Amphidinium_carterae.1
MQLTQQHLHLDPTSFRGIAPHMRFWNTSDEETMTLPEYMLRTRTHTTTAIYYVTQDMAGLLTQRVRSQAPLLLVLRN